MKTLIGILPATAGQVKFNGADVTKSAMHRRVRSGLCYVSQGRGILPGLTTVRENLLLAAAAVGGGKRERRLEEVVEDVPRLRDCLDRPGGALSGGERQLLALARALMQNPKIVLLDEPTEGIQPSIIADIADLLGVLRQRRGLTILLAEQSIHFIKDLSDRVLLIQRGASPMN